MKLNYDCIRDIMLSTEELGFQEKLNLERYKEYSNLSKYSYEEIQYNALKLHEGQYIKGIKSSASNVTVILRIYDLTLEGHDLLNSMRSNTVFAKAKDRISKTVGSVTLATLKSVCLKIANDMLFG